MSRRREPLPLGDGSARDAARMMGISPSDFLASLPQLERRGFPLPDPTTGQFDLDAVAAWRRRRHPHLFTTDNEGGLTSPRAARGALDVVKGRLEALSRGNGEDPVLRR
jgi:hypothetical protein